MTTARQRRLSSMPYHCELLWALIQENGGKTSMCYRLEKSPQQLYKTICKEEMLGTGHTPQTLKDAGWVARPIRIEELSSIQS